MKKFHITVKDNEDGTVYIDADSNSIIGAVSLDGGTQALGLTNVKMDEIIQTIIAAENVINKIKDGNPIFPLAIEFFKKANLVKEEEN